MKQLGLKLGIVITVGIVLSSCGSVKITDSWKEVQKTDLENKSVLVVSNSQRFAVRERFETDLVNQLETRGINATESFKQYPELTPLNEENSENLKVLGDAILENGYDVVALTILRDIEEYTETVTSGTTYTVNSYPGYYGRRGVYRSFYRGFHTIYLDGGPYQTVVSKNKKYILETLVYDLTKLEKEQLLTVVTSVVDNPDNLGNTSKDFSRQMARALTK